MSLRLQPVISSFASSDPELRLELLSDFAEQLPELPPRLVAERDAGRNRVRGCLSPVFVWVETQDGRLIIWGDAPRETPTVRGFLGVLVDTLSGGFVSDATALSEDLLSDMGVDEVVGMRRSQGLRALIAFVRNQATRLER